MALSKVSVATIYGYVYRVVEIYNNKCGRQRPSNKPNQCLLIEKF